MPPTAVGQRLLGRNSAAGMSCFRLISGPPLDGVWGVRALAAAEGGVPGAPSLGSGKAGSQRQTDEQRGNTGRTAANWKSLDRRHVPLGSVF